MSQGGAARRGRAHCSHQQKMVALPTPLTLAVVRAEIRYAIRGPHPSTHHSKVKSQHLSITASSTSYNLGTLSHQQCRIVIYRALRVLVRGISKTYLMAQARMIPGIRVDICAQRICYLYCCCTSVSAARVRARGARASIAVHMRTFYVQH